MSLFALIARELIFFSGYFAGVIALCSGSPIFMTTEMDNSV